MNRFLITGMGRSGTKFLAQTLNQAPGWCVEHEPEKGFRPTIDAAERFGRRFPENYGEANSYLRFQALSLERLVPELSLAVIIRDPVEIFYSMAARGKPDLLHLFDALQAIDALAQAGVPVLSFSRFTTDPIYLSRFSSAHFGLVLNPKDISLAPVNATYSADRKPISPSLSKDLDKGTAWFREMYQRNY